MIKIFFRKLQLNYLINSLQEEMRSLSSSEIHLLKSYNSVLTDLQTERRLL